ncbi:hypothetical protein BC941DRAFT_436289 [Chlamydoabsidia padenii]|nr:hypothetical protein BC941DRAFT_436289 [Chlamydoabsidia padenii]
MYIKSFFLTLAIVLFTLSSAAPLMRRAPAVVHTRCTVPGTFALTFDDGPFNQTWDLIKMLNQQNIKATFFINGHNFGNIQTDSVATSDGVKSYLDHLVFMHQSGHQIASHTYEHRVLTGLPETEIVRQMNALSDIIFQTIHVRPRYMRPPTGAYDASVLAVLGNLGYEVAMWDIDPKDFESYNLQSKEAVFTGFLNQEIHNPPTSAHLSLMHDVHPQTTPYLVPWVIQHVQAKNYRFATVAECLNDPRPYH